MSNDLWRWADPDGQQRKVRFDELRAALAGGLIAPNTPVWRSGWANWQPAQEVPELTSASVGGANGVVLNIPPPPLAMLAVQQEYEASSGSIAPPPPPGPIVHDAEPPPPPAYVPLPTKAASIHPSSGQMKTQMGGSAHVPTAPPTGFTPVGGIPNAPGSAPRLGPSLPTAIGIPPPPEILNMTQPLRGSGGGGSGGKPSAPPPPPRSAPGGAEIIEELSGSMLLDASSNPQVGGPFAHANGAGSSNANANALQDATDAMIRGPGDGLPPPTDPIVHGDGSAPRVDGGGGGGDDLDEPAGLPRRPGLSLILDDIALIRQKKPPKNKLLIGVLGFVSLMILIMLVAGIVSIASGGSNDKDKDKDKNKKLASGSSSVSTPSTPPVDTSPTSSSSAAAIPSVPTTAPTDDKPSGPSLGDCTVSSEAKSIAPRAQIASGIESHALAGGLALGFAPGPRDAVATSLDPASLNPTSTARAKPFGGDVRRVTPILIGGKLAANPDVDRKGDKLGGRRLIAPGTLIDIGHTDGSIVWAPHGRDSSAKLFTADGEGAIEALRGVHLSDRKGIAFAYRRGNSINIGVAKGDNTLEAEGEMSKIAGLGQVGSPAIAASGDRIIVVWADRAGANDDWAIRWAKFKVGSSTSDASTFTIPEGGLGGQAMSPSVASLGGGRFLLAWTEGPVSNHQVRAITIGADGSPSGSAIAISASGVNAGQPSAVIAADGRGAVAFLAAKGKALEVHATPIHCPSNK